MISIRQLGKHISAVIQAVEETREPLTITREGRPVARLVPLLSGLTPAERADARGPS